MEKASAKRKLSGYGRRNIARTANSNLKGCAQDALPAGDKCAFHFFPGLGHFRFNNQGDAAVAKFIIKGGKTIGGTFHPRGNKNAVLPMLAACVMTEEPVVLNNVPLINDVKVMLQLLESIGVEVSLNGHTATLCAHNLRTTELDETLCAKVRTSILLAGPLTARHGGAKIYPPGGDVIGRRRLDTHFYGLRSLGADIAIDKAYRFKAGPLHAWKMVFDEASVTATLPHGSS